MNGVAKEWIQARRDAPWTAGMTLLMRIERWDARRDGPLSETALQHRLDSHGYQVSVRSYPAGTVAVGRRSPDERIQAVVTGLLKVTIDGESAILSAGDLVFMPRGSVRSLEVVGPSLAHCVEGVTRH